MQDEINPGICHEILVFENPNVLSSCSIPGIGVAIDQNRIPCRMGLDVVRYLLQVVCSCLDVSVYSSI